MWLLNVDLQVVCYVDLGTVRCIDLRVRILNVWLGELHHSA